MSLYHSDGRQPAPLARGKTSDDSFLSDIGKLLEEKFVKPSGGNVSFSALALVGGK